MSLIRWILSIFILAYEKVATPKGIKRSFSEQADVNDQTRKLTMYQYKACPFCLKVRFAIARLSLKIITRDAKRSEMAKAELLEGGGKLKVPCLKIVEDNGEVTWMYESNDIIAYLENRFGEKPMDAETA